MVVGLGNISDSISIVFTGESCCVENTGCCCVNAMVALQLRKRVMRRDGYVSNMNWKGGRSPRAKTVQFGPDSSNYCVIN